MQIVLMDDQKTMLTVGKDKKFVVYDIITGSKIFSDIKHEKPVYTVCLTLDGKYCFTAG
jgi:hypothetical protein